MQKRNNEGYFGRLNADLELAEDRWLDEDLAEIHALLDKDYTAEPRDMRPFLRQPQPEDTILDSMPEEDGDDYLVMRPEKREPAPKAKKEVKAPQPKAAPAKPAFRKEPRKEEAPKEDTGKKPAPRKEAAPKEPGGKKFDWAIPALAALATAECAGIVAVIVWWSQWM